MSTLPRTLDAIAWGMARGWHLGAQLYVSMNHRVLADAGVGEARAGVAMSADSISLWMSSGKPVTAVAVGVLIERGLIALDDPVMKYIPEFGNRGKEPITVRHLLTHTAGIRAAGNTWTLDSWEQVLMQICAARIEPNWIPGQKAGYHQGSTWFILGELIRRVSGRPFNEFVKAEVFTPLGMRDSAFALTSDEYRAYGDRIVLLHPQWCSQEYAALVRPGASFKAPARDLGKFYEAMLDGGAGVLPPATVSMLTTRQRTGMFDHTFKHDMDWGLGFILNSARNDVQPPYGFGPYASENAFGHGGQRSSVGMADPAHKLVVALAFNGLPTDAEHDERLRETLAAVYEDLELA